MIAESMRQVLFPGTTGEPSKLAVRNAKALLSQFGLDKGVEVEVDPVCVDLPPLKGDNLLEHFDNISYDLAQPYLSLAEKLATMVIPEMPEEWLMKPGWVRYEPGLPPESVSTICEAESVFDVEVAVEYGDYPVMAAAVTSAAWYYWCSPWLWRAKKTALVPFGDGEHLSVGWNCFPEDTDVLTNKGWKRIREVKVGDKVLSLNKSSGENEFTKVTGLVEGGEQEVIESISRGKKTRSTRNHRWITQKAWDLKTTKFQVKTTEELMNSGKYSKDNYVVSRPYINPNPSGITPDEASLLAWILGDGNIQFRNRTVEVTITQSKNNYDYVEKITRLIERCGEEVKFYDFDRDCRRFILKREWLARVLSKSGISLDKDYLKGLDSLVLNLSYEALESFVESFWYAEGVKGLPKLSTICQNYSVNREKYEALELACYLLGRVVTSDKSLKRVNSHERGSYQVAYTKYKSLGKKKVYCIQTEAENFVIRQGRFITLTMNCSYDRARVEEEYNPKGNKIRFLDAMSLHVAIAGLSGKQRNHFMAIRKHLNDDDYEGHIPKWADEATMNSLKDASEFYLGEKMDKNIRDIFVSGTKQEIVNKFQELAQYNADDVLKTTRIFQIVWKRFRRSCPSNVTFAAMLTMGKAYLPVQDRWQEYLNRCGRAYNVAVSQIKTKLNTLAEKTIKEYGEEGTKDPNNCPWLRNLDWNLPGKRATKQRDKPEWYRKATGLGKKSITASMNVTPYLLRMSWLGYPLYYDKDMKWGYLVPKNEEYTSNTPCYEVEGFPDKDFYKVPHKDGEKANCGNPLAKDYLDSMESGVLTAEDPDAQEIIELSISISYWTSVKGRAYDQFVWYHPKDAKYEAGVILPQMKVCGTVTRRAVEPTWLTASNPKPNRIGSEIKTAVKVPEGYVRIGADVDSQELWLSDLIGDSFVGVIGGTPSSLQTLIGTKENKKDMHTVFAAENGMGRDGAKQCVPLDSEALTRKGWKNYHELSIGEEIMTFDPETDSMEWQPILDLVYNEASDTYRMSNGENQFNFVSTSNHRWYGSKRQKIGGVRKYYDQGFTTEQVGKEHRIKMSASISDKADNGLEIADVKAIAWILSDGSHNYSKTRGLYYCYIFQSKEENFPRIESSLANTHYSKNKNSKGITSWAISATHCRDLHNRLGIKHDLSNLVEWVLTLNREQLEVYLETFWLAEGHWDRGTKVIQQNEGIELETIKLAAQLLGYKVSCNFKEVTASGKNHYSVRLIEKDYISAQRIKKEFESNQPTWCPTVENGFWLMRQHKENLSFMTITGNCNYARRYGSGLSAQVTYYRQFIKGLSDMEARNRAKKGMEKTKGRKKNGKYVGGTESTMFNMLERIATSRDPRTPFLNCGISDALHPRNVGRDHMPSRVNWVVQSSGVDFLHCLIVASETLFKQHGLWYRFMISVHDEVHWIFEKENMHLACYLFQIAHLWVRAFFNYQCGFNDISETVAWFSGVDVDFTWRKTVSSPCLTPSNSFPIGSGIDVTIHDIVDKLDKRPELFGEKFLNR